jgi:hypothetical protein
MSIAGSSFLGSQSRRRTASSKLPRHRALVKSLERQQFESAQSCGTHVFQACPLGCGTDRNGAQGAILRPEGAQDRHGAFCGAGIKEQDVRDVGEAGETRPC